MIQGLTHTGSVFNGGARAGANVRLCVLPAHAAARWQMAWSSRSLSYMLNVLYDSQRAALRDEMEHNIMTDEGLLAWLENFTTLGADKSRIRYFEVGTSGTAEADTDTDLGTLTGQYEKVQLFRYKAEAHFMLWLAEGDQNGNTLREGGLRFDDAATITNPRVKDKLLNRFTHDPVAKTDRMIVIYHVTQKLVWDTSDPDFTGYDWGAGYMMSKLIDPDEFGVIDHAAVGTGTGLAIDARLAEYLAAETFRDAVTATSVNGLSLFLQSQGSITAAENPNQIEEIGQAVGSTANKKVLWRYLTSFDNSAETAFYFLRLTFSNL